MRSTPKRKLFCSNSLNGARNGLGFNLYDDLLVKGNIDFFARLRNGKEIMSTSRRADLG